MLNFCVTFMSSSNNRDMLCYLRLFLLFFVFIFHIIIEHVIYILILLWAICSNYFNSSLLSSYWFLLFSFLNSLSSFFYLIFYCFEFCLFNRMLFFKFSSMQIFVISRLNCFLRRILRSCSFRSLLCNGCLFSLKKACFPNNSSSSTLFTNIFHFCFLFLELFF